MCPSSEKTYVRPDGCGHNGQLEISTFEARSDMADEHQDAHDRVCPFASNRSRRKDHGYAVQPHRQMKQVGFKIEAQKQSQGREVGEIPNRVKPSPTKISAPNTTQRQNIILPRQRNVETIPHREPLESSSAAYVLREGWPLSCRRPGTEEDPSWTARNAKPE